MILTRRAAVRWAPVAAAACLSFAALGADRPINAAPYVPSPQSVVADMLKLADVKPNDFVIDLGSGDGRIVLTAAKVFGARGFGVEIKDELVKRSNATAAAQGLAGRVRFMKADLFTIDISQATVLTLYLLPKTVNLLREKLLAELKPGTRVISHDYPLDGWDHIAMKHLDLADKIQISGVTTTLIYLYLVPANVAGRWRATVPATIDANAIELDLRQAYTRVSGDAQVKGVRTPIVDGRVRGKTLSFAFTTGGRVHAFEGTLHDGAVTGVVVFSGRRAAWRASQLKKGR
jgi:hypothetical protein